MGIRNIVTYAVSIMMYGDYPRQKSRAMERSGLRVHDILIYNFFIDKHVLLFYNILTLRRMEKNNG